jgi:two-component system sensor histidine kinase AlgZ
MPSTRTNAYARCQAVGWTVWGAMNMTYFALVGIGNLRTLGWTIFSTAVGFALSHGYRALIRRQRWIYLPLRGLAPRVIVASVVLAFLLDVPGSIAARIATPGTAPPFSLEISGIYLLNFSILYLGWSMIYFAVHWLERSRRAERAELRYLKSQLNPHFLYNALNSVRALIGEDPARAQEAITRLAKLLRVALGSVTADTVPLADELAVVDDYLALEAVRLEHRLSVSLDIAPDALAVRVPSMLVQTLVENAIKHGVARRPGGGQLTVHAHVRDHMLEVCVDNTPAPEPASSGGDGVGLANASERLQLLFGARASLTLDRSRADRTRAEARIPIEGARGEGARGG